MPTPIWRHPDLLKVLIGETISDFGSEIGGLALPLLAALTLDASAAQMASLLIAEFVPRIVVAAVAGAWIDRVLRRRLLIATNLLRSVILMVVAALAWRNQVSIELLYGVALALAGLDVLFSSAFAAYVPTLVPGPMLVVANGARATSSAAASVLGPAVAGVLIAILGAPLAILADAVSFLASVGGLSTVRASEPPLQLQERHPARAIAEGWQELLRNPMLRAFAATAFTANFFYRVVMAVYVLYLTRDLNLSPAAVGAIFGFGGGLGVLVGSALAAPVARRFDYGPTMIGAHALFGLFGIPLALSAALPAQAAVLVFASEFLQLSVNAVYMVNRTTLEQVVSPPALRGRIQSTRNVVHAIAGVLGLLVGGALGEYAGPGVAVVVGVIGGTTSVAWLIASPLRTSKLRE